MSLENTYFKNVTIPILSLCNDILRKIRLLIDRYIF